MKVLHYNGRTYPAFQAEGFAAQFIIPFALRFCTGVGYDVGCNTLEWCLPGAIPIDPRLDSTSDALNLPTREVDYIFSSHCLEHIQDWVGVLNYWLKVVKPGGVIFLYLPHYSQEYWRPWNNRKHLHCFTPQLLTDFFNARGVHHIFTSERDLNDSFCVVVQTLKFDATIRESDASADL